MICRNFNTKFNILNYARDYRAIKSKKSKKNQNSTAGPFTQAVLCEFL